MEDHKSKNDNEERPLSWREYAIAAVIIMIAVIGLVWLLTPTIGNVFSNITPGRPVR